MLPPIQDQQQLEVLVVQFFVNNGTLEHDGQKWKAWDHESPNFRVFYTALEPSNRADLQQVCANMLPRYREMQQKYAGFTDEKWKDFLREMECQAMDNFDLKTAAPELYRQVSEMAFQGSNPNLQPYVLFLLGHIGKEGVISREQWRSLYHQQPNQYKLQTHMALRTAEIELAEEVLPDLKEKVDANTFLETVFWTVHRRYNPQRKKDKNQLVKEKLFQYATPEEWLSTSFGQGFTERGKRTYFERIEEETSEK